MENLLYRICWLRGEDVLTETLAILIKENPEYRAALLSFINESIKNEECTITTQHVISDQSRPDLCITEINSDWVVFLENKPWDWSTFTDKNNSNDQISRYAEELKKIKAEKKFLCLLTNEVNKPGLLNAIVELEKIEGNKPKDILIKEFYEKQNIKFIVFTWEDLILELSKATCNDTLCKFLFESLKNCLKEKCITADLLKCKELAENYPDIKRNMDAAGTFLVDNGFAIRVESKTNPARKGDEKYYFIKLLTPHLGRCFFAASPYCHARIKDEKGIELPHYYFFIIENADGNEERFPIITNENILPEEWNILQEEWNFTILHDVPLTKNKNMVYLAPLDFSIDSSKMMSKDIAVSVAKIIKKLNNVYLRKKNELEIEKNELEIEQQSKKDEAALRALEEL